MGVSLARGASICDVLYVHKFKDILLFVRTYNYIWPDNFRFIEYTDDDDDDNDGDMSEFGKKSFSNWSKRADDILVFLT